MTFHFISETITLNEAAGCLVYSRISNAKAFEDHRGTEMISSE